MAGATYMRLCSLALCLALSTSAHAQTYTTTFPLTENPISEGGSRWTNGAAVGLDWKDVQTTPGKAFGTQDNSSAYDDSTALLTGTWGADQAVQATAFCNEDGQHSEEVEIRLRSAISAHSNTGYEINFNCSTTGGGYSQIVRWNGAEGDFTVLNPTGPGASLQHGDTVYVEIVGTTITAKVNGSMVMTVSDNTFSSGKPGIGFFQRLGASHNSTFGFTSMSASSPPGAVTPPVAPTSLGVSN